MTNFSPTDRTRIHRLPARGNYDRDVVFSILDEALVCHLAYVVDGQPYAIPTTFARKDDRLYVHGAAASRTLKTMAGGVRVCFTATILDGIVYARSAFHHSMNYRSVVVLGTAVEITDPIAKRRALDAIVDRTAPSRSQKARKPNDKELAATRVLELPIEEVSAKIRTGGPVDDEEDLALPVWAGHVPLRLHASDPIRAEGVAPDLASPSLEKLL
jgi:nitroimidazol reductase NimA-like FMN-containing flavoprotein (pyridoxamine 5'-phosphate oxidase superfamily)